MSTVTRIDDHPIHLALAAGKIKPAMLGWATKYYRKDPKGFLQYLHCTEPDGAISRSFEDKSAQASAIASYARERGLRFGEARLEAIRELRDLENGNRCGPDEAA